MLNTMTVSCGSLVVSGVGVGVGVMRRVEVKVEVVEEVADEMDMDGMRGTEREELGEEDWVGGV